MPERCFISSKCTYKVWHMQIATCTCVGLKIARVHVPVLQGCLVCLFAVIQHLDMNGEALLCL